MQLGELCNCFRVLGRSACLRDKYWQKEALSVSRADEVAREVWWSVAGLGTERSLPEDPCGRRGAAAGEMRLSQWACLPLKREQLLPLSS